MPPVIPPMGICSIAKRVKVSMIYLTTRQLIVKAEAVIPEAVLLQTLKFTFPDVG